jgi:hypothetical protein
MHTVLSIDTMRLLERHAAKIRLSPINSGSTIYNPQPRGVGTFKRMQDYPFEERKKLRGLGNAIAELAVQYAVPDILDIVVAVEHRRGNKVLEVIYST